MNRRTFSKMIATGLALPSLLRVVEGRAAETAPAKPQRVPILVYHHVYPEHHPELKVGPRVMASGLIGRDAFSQQIEYLRSEGWQVINTSRLVDWLETGAPIPTRAVVLHFDNGWLDASEVAAPILKEHGMTATSYIISEPTAAASEGKPAGIRTATEGFVVRPFLTWDNAKALRDSGWEIGAHTATHPKLADLLAKGGEAKFREEIEVSNGLFQKHLGSIPDHFAYPSGSRNEQTDEILAKIYRSLRRWRFSQPPAWMFTDRTSPRTALESQNIDNTVAFEDFKRIFTEAQ